MKHLLVHCLCMSVLSCSPLFAQNWTLETVAPFGRYFDLAVDSTDAPHIIYTNCQAWELCDPATPGAPQLTYGTKTGSGWVFETVASNPQGDLVAIILDAAGTPHAAYQDSTRQMHYTFRDGGGWVIEDLYHEMLLRYRASPSLVLDTSSEPHIAFIERERIRYAYRTGGAWTDEEVTGSSLDNWSARAAITIDGAGTLHVGSWMYYASAVYFTRGTSSWSWDLVNGDIGWNPWMVLDSSDVAHFTYHGFSGLSYATGTVGNWLEELIDPQAANEDNDITLDDNGRPFVVYSTSVLVTYEPPYLYDVGLHLAWRHNGVWAKERIDSVRNVELWRMSPRLEIGPTGTIHILYHHPPTGEMRYGTRSVPTFIGSSSPHLSPRFIGIMPNPFSTETKIVFELGSKEVAALTIYDVSGRRVRRLFKSAIPSGRHRLSWDGKMDSGAEAPSGVYFVRLETGSRTETRRAVLIR